MSRCEHIQQTLAESGPDALNRDPRMQQHVEDCVECSAFLQALNELDTDLAGMPEQDAPDALVASTLQAVEQAEAPQPAASWFERHRFPLASGFAALFITVSIGGLWQAGLREIVLEPDIAYESHSQSPPAPIRFTDQDDSIQLGTAPSQMKMKAPPELELGDVDIPVLQEAEFEDSRGEESFARYRENQQAALEELRGLTSAVTPSEEPVTELDSISVTDSLISKRRDAVSSGSSNPETTATEQPSPPASPAQSEIVVVERNAARKWMELPEPANDDNESQTQLVRQKQLQLLAEEVREAALEQEGLELQPSRIAGQSKFMDTQKESPAGEDKADIYIGLQSDEAAPEPELRQQQFGAFADQSAAGNRQASPSNDADEAPATPAQQFLQQLDSLDNLTFQPATGYWSHNYIPGDPAMRLLQTQLSQWDRSELGEGLRLEQASQPIWQPFDMPGNAALATYLHSDKTHIDGPTRMRLQVGLQASEREGGQRPAMNLAVVLDLRDATGNQFDTEIRALLEGLSHARQSGDRFSLTVAGKSGGLVIPAGDFRHGPVALAVEQLFGDGPSRPDTALDVSGAIDVAAKDLMNNAATDATLGANLMLLVTASSLADDLETLQRQVHQNAVDGLLLSAVSLGGQTVAGDIDRLVLAGQGNRRTLARASDARQLIEKELYAASRAVARAIRVRIQLASGVRLIQVHGSERLDAARIERVKQAENSIDQRLVEKLGITADRGEDEAGIQMVIPAMNAGASHVILLDVVAEQPGPIADVQVRYKDLVHLDNAVARAQLNLSGQQRSAGRLERNVVKNLLSLQLANDITHASELLAEANLEGAKLQLHKTRRLLTGLREQLPAWSSDAELAGDEQMINDYLAALRSSAIQTPRQRDWLAMSLELAAHRKIAGSDP